MTYCKAIASVALLALCAGGPALAADAAPRREAPRLVAPEKAPIHAAALAGRRTVAVGDYGVVILCEGDGKFRQAAKVATRATLTSVYFIDDKQGWAAGHDGTVLGTADGGDHWQVLRETPGKDQVLLSVWFENANHGLAVGQFGLAVETDDGGKSWHERRLVDKGEAAERHLLNIVPGADGLLLVAAEAGSIFRSTDNGRDWSLVQTDNKGSFWTGTALADGTLLMAGMRGHVYRSTDRGLSWKEVQSGTQQSITAAVRRQDGAVRMVGMSGVSLTSKDGGASFETAVRSDRVGLTAIACGPAGDMLFALSGVVSSR